MEPPPRRRFGRDRPPTDDGQLTVSVELDRGRAWLRISGDLDVLNATRVREIVRDIERRHPHTIVFDLRTLDFIDSSGISELLIARRRGERVGRRVLLATAPESQTARVLAMTGIDAVMESVEGGPPAAG
jgi:anti-sigma B factor antagonist